jgi:hypothetical protein
MTTARTETINALENVIAESAALLDKAIVLNVLIRSKRLPLPLINLPAIYKTQEAAEVMLKEFELRAMAAA